MLAFLVLVPVTQALLFGGTGGCGCVPPPVCPPPPVCAPPPCGSSVSGGSYASAPQQPAQYTIPVMLQPAYELVEPQLVAYPPSPQKIDHSTTNEVKANPLKSNKLDDEYTAQTSGERRVRRDNESVFDPKCNSEALKEIILKNLGNTTAIAKRQIQEAATERLGGRIDVICSSGTFSYIVNTELYCETESDGTTCFAFRQSS